MIFSKHPIIEEKFVSYSKSNDAHFQWDGTILNGQTSPSGA